MSEKDKDVQKKSLGSELLGWVVYIAFIMFVCWAVVTFIGQRTKVDGQSMEPSLFHNDQLIVDKLSYRFREPERYDIIVFPYQHEENTYYIKRIIGLPGETVQVVDGSVYINGDPLTDEQYGAEPMEMAGIAEVPIKLGEDEYFVLGDNRNHSKDSRDPSVGVLTRDQLMGRAWLRIYPFDRFGFIRHK